MNRQGTLRVLAQWIFVACGTWLLGLGGYFMLVRAPLLPEDLRFLGSSAGQVDVALPRLGAWLHNVFVVMGGFIAGCGVLIIFVGMRAVPQSLRGTGVALGCAGLLTVAIMSWTNFVLDSKFKWLLLAPAMAWLFGLVSYEAARRAGRPIVAVAPTKVDAPNE